MDNKPSDMEKQGTLVESPKKGYQAPRLTRHGAIVDLTNNTGPKGPLDGGGGAGAGPKTAA